MVATEIGRNDRITIACSFYGLYMLGFATTDSQRIDEDCAMDNMRVPYYKHQLTSEQQLYLTNFDVWLEQRGKKIDAWIEAQKRN